MQQINSFAAAELIMTEIFLFYTNLSEWEIYICVSNFRWKRDIFIRLKTKTVRLSQMVKKSNEKRRKTKGKDNNKSTIN